MTLFLFDPVVAMELVEAFRIYEGRLQGTGRRLSPGTREIVSIAERSVRVRTGQPSAHLDNAADNECVNRLLTVRDVADTLSCSDSTVKRLVSSGELRSVHVGRSVRVRPADLQQYINDLASVADATTEETGVTANPDQLDPGDETTPNSEAIDGATHDEPLFIIGSTPLAGTDVLIP